MSSAIYWEQIIEYHIKRNIISLLPPKWNEVLYNLINKDLNNLLLTLNKLLIMGKGLFNVPIAKCEPVKSYAPGSEERRGVQIRKEKVCDGWGGAGEHLERRHAGRRIMAICREKR